MFVYVLFLFNLILLFFVLLQLYMQCNITESCCHVASLEKNILLLYLIFTSIDCTCIESLHLSSELRIFTYIFCASHPLSVCRAKIETVITCQCVCFLSGFFTNDVTEMSLSDK